LRLGSHYISCRHSKDGNASVLKLNAVGNMRVVSQATGKLIGKDSRCKDMSNCPRRMLEQTYLPLKK